MRDPVMLCGAMFGLETYRHRLFETNWRFRAPGHPEHVAKTTKMGRATKPGEFMHVVGNFSGIDHGRKVMGMDWANGDGLREAIPPRYAEWVGAALMDLGPERSLEVVRAHGRTVAASDKFPSRIEKIMRDAENANPDTGGDL